MKKFAICTVLLSLGTLVLAGCAEEEKKTTPSPQAAQDAAATMESMMQQAGAQMPGAGEGSAPATEGTEEAAGADASE